MIKTEEIVVTFFVPGVPATAGSKRPHLNKKTGKIYVSDDCERGPSWRSSVETQASRSYTGEVLRGPLSLSIIFHQVRPLTHYGTGKNVGVLRPHCPQYPAKRPDATKLFRATEDALKGILWADDGQIVIARATKLYGELAGNQLVAHVYENGVCVEDWK